MFTLNNKTLKIVNNLIMMMMVLCKGSFIGLKLRHLGMRWVRCFLHGRRPRGELGGWSPKNLRWGMAHASVPPIFREVVFVGGMQKHEQSKKRCHQGIIFWNRGFSREEMVIYDIMKWKFFPKKRHSEILVCEIFFRLPHTRRQVSVYGFFVAFLTDNYGWATCPRSLHSGLR